MPDQRWFIHPALKGEAHGLAQQIGLSPLLAQVLLNRDIDTPEAALDFLNPEKLSLPSPLDEFPDLEQSVEILLQAIEFQEKIAICGDYDADGMTSTALLLRALRALGAQVDYAIPSRMQEGYGINQRIVEEFATDGVSVILTVDNGIAAVEPIAYARELGLTVIVTDHHDVPPEIPPAHAILNPKLIAEDSPYRGVAGVGVAYILAVCLAQALGKTQDLTTPLLELFTLGTIADLAPLTDVNRRWVRRGLRLLPKSRLLGVQALIQVAGLGKENGSLKPEDIGFKLGPRINAVGRIGDPQTVIELLTTDDATVALERAMECEQANQKRQTLCEGIETEAIAWVEAQQQAGSIDIERDRVLLIVQPEWHHGVIGIVASRLVERYGVPVFICTYEDDEHKEIRGSARGIPEFNVFEALQSCQGLMTKFGGHKAAGGFSFPTKHLRQVKSRLVKFANQTLQPEHLKPLVTVDVRASLAELTSELYTEIDALHPCGIGNPDPVFWTPDVRVVEQRSIGEHKTHLKLVLAGDEGQSLEAIAWRWGSYCPLPERLDVAYKLKLNEWQGQRTIQLELVGVRPATSVPPVRSQTQSQSQTLPTRRTGNATLQLPFEPGLTPHQEQTTKRLSPPAADLPISTSSQAPAVSDFPVPYATQMASSPSTTLNSTRFFYSHRQYQTQIFNQGDAREVQIHNSEGHVLVVLLPEKKGYLWIPGENAHPVNLSEVKYFNLVRAALDALEIRQKTHLLMEKDELLAEKDQHIAALMQQVQFLQEKLGQLTATQQQQFDVLQAEVQAQETVIQSQEAHIATIEQQMNGAPAALDPQVIKQDARDAVGDKIWFCLHQKSQKDLYAAYKHVALNRANDDPQLANYAEAGIRLGAVIEREFMQPWFEELGAFLASQGKSVLGGVQFSVGRKYNLTLAAALVANEWVTVRSPALQSPTRPDDGGLYVTARPPKAIGGSDRALLSDFFEQWEHPLQAWFLDEPQRVAGQLDQIGKLQNFASDTQHPFRYWVFELMQDLIIGSLQQPGLLHHIR